MFSLFAGVGYNGAVVCTECMENGYSKSDSDYLPQGLGPVCLEYQQHLHHMDYSVPVPLGVDTGPYTASLCNGTSNGVRRDTQPPAFPSNHNVLSSQRNHKNRKGRVLFLFHTVEDRMRNGRKYVVDGALSCVDQPAMTNHSEGNLMKSRIEFPLLPDSQGSRSGLVPGCCTFWQGTVWEELGVRIPILAS